MTRNFLLHLTVVAFGLIAHAAASLLSVTAPPVYAISEQERQSPRQSAARDYTIAARDKAADFAYIGFTVNAPANVFVSYAPNATAGNSSYGSIKVSGTSTSAVDYIVVEGDPRLQQNIHIYTDDKVGQRLDRNDAVLIEIQLYQKRTLKNYFLKGNGTTVLSENVVFTSTTGDGDCLLRVSDSTLFVVDPTATLTTDIEVNDYNTAGLPVVQVEAARINNPAGLNVTCGGQSHDVRLFVDTLPNVNLLVDDYGKDNTVCVASKSPVDVVLNRVTDMFSDEGTKVPPVSHRIPAGSPCTKLSPPKREPVVINTSGSTSISTSTPSSADQGPSTVSPPTSVAYQSTAFVASMVAAMAVTLAVLA